MSLDIKILEAARSLNNLRRAAGRLDDHGTAEWTKDCILELLARINGGLCDVCGEVCEHRDEASRFHCAACVRGHAAEKETFETHLANYQRGKGE